MRSSLPDVQYVMRPGVVELRAGHPDLALLPAEGLLQAARLVLGREARQALSYGTEQGPGCLLHQLSEWLERAEGVPAGTDEVMVTGGSSQALGMLCTLLTRRGDLALVQSPTYHLAMRVLREDHGLELGPVPGDQDGLDISALEQTLVSLARQGRRARLLYLVSTFNNPTGATLAPDRRRELLVLAERHGLLVIDDDVYYQLWYDRPPPPTLRALEGGGRVIRLGSFSKIMAPGLRLGWLQAPPEVIAACTSCGVLDSGGGVGHFTAHLVAAFMKMGLLEPQLELLRQRYRERRDRLLEALRHHLPEGCTWQRPGGGFFVWLRLPAGLDSRELLPAAEAGGVSYLAGPLFHPAGGAGEYCRLNFTMVPEAELEEGARRLGAVLRRRGQSRC